MVEGSNIARRRAAARKEGSPAYQEKLDQLVATASAVFRDKGYQATTLNDIAEVLGTDRASLYYYVSSKEDLLHAAVRDIATTNAQIADDIMKSSLPAKQKIQQFITTILLSYNETYPQIFVFLEHDLGKLTNQRSAWAKSMMGQVRKIEGVVADMLDEGVKDGSFRSDLDIEYVAKALWGMVNWTHRWYKPGPAKNAQAIADTFAALFLDGFSNQASPSDQQPPGTGNSTEIPAGNTL